MWDCDTPGTHYNELFCGDELSAHLRDHGICGTDKLHFTCLWKCCGVELNKESVVWHVKEKHLAISYACNICNQALSHKYKLDAHHRKNHPTQQ
jgi:hypothetical protein